MKHSSEFSSKQRNILNFRPNIHFVEPQQIEDNKLPFTEQTTSIDQIKQDVNDLIAEYGNLQVKADDLQTIIDSKSSTVEIKLDDNLDAAVLAALRRHFKDPNKSTITYNDYISCLKIINDAGIANATNVDQNDVLSSASDPNRIVFGTLNIDSGLARPELASHAQVIPPLDMNNFQVEQLEQLFESLVPKITGLVTKLVPELVGL
jgi:hypothetical protein